MTTLNGATLTSFTNMNAERHIDKAPANAACWNWALYGAIDDAPQASVLFSYVCRNADGRIQQVTRQEAEGQLRANANNVWASLQAGRPLRNSLDGIRRAYDNGEDNTGNRNAIRESVFDLSIQAAGFTISNAATSYRICMFEPQDVVMWDHWWLEINGCVVETITGQQLYAYSSQYLGPAFNHPRNRVNLRTTPHGLSAAMQARVHARYVTSIQDRQARCLMQFA